MNIFYPNFKSGFTIVETIVSLAIIGILAAGIISVLLGKSQQVQAATNNNSQVTTSELVSEATTAELFPDEDTLLKTSEAVSRKMEQRIVQTAMDIMMISEGLLTVNETGFVSNMASFPQGQPLYPFYLREDTTQYQYRCNIRGEVEQLGN